MTLPYLSHTHELDRAAKKLGIKLRIVTGPEAERHILRAFRKFKPWKPTGHLSIGGASKIIPAEENEMTYSHALAQQPAYIFFEQNHPNKNTLAILENARNISTLMSECYGMEYFITNKNASHLIAVNWHAIESIGDAEIS